MGIFVRALVTIINCVLLCNCEETIKLLGLLPMTGKGWVGGIPCELASRLALQDINTSSKILKGYKLHYDYIDSEVHIFVVSLLVLNPNYW